VTADAQSKATGMVERRRLAAADAGTADWRAWGPYVSERAWGTVREDYSASGDAWNSFPHDHARSRAYRWNEDGLAGLCDLDQRWCFALALWNGRDPILKERIFGLTGPQGNHGEDAKEYWWYVDATPTASWLSWRYHYPQAAFPYDELVAVNASRGKDVGEWELLDSGVFDEDRYFAVSVDYAKADVDDMCIRITVDNRGPDEAALHVLPTLWLRNRWAWDGRDPLGVIRADGARLVLEEPGAATLVLAGDGTPVALTCDNDTNGERLWGVAGRSSYPKDGINDHVVNGAPTVNPLGVGTKAALHYPLTVPGGGSATIRLRLSGRAATPNLKADWSRVMAARAREADDFHASLLPAGTSADDALIARQAIAGMVWGKQFFHYDVDRWLRGDPAEPVPPAARLSGRNSGWRHLNNHDVLSMPDPWEYPWYAAWDLAFHTVTLALIDPEFAKQQLITLCREWYMHPAGQLPAYEWDFSDVNPPVHAWAAMRIFRADGSRDFDFLERMFHKLTINFTWWVNRKDAEGNNVFEGGFLGLDNIGPFDRSTLPVSGTLEQSDATSWMARYCLDLLEIALTLAKHDRTYTDVATKFFEHYAYISQAAVDAGLWDEKDGFFYDSLRLPSGERVPVRVRSMVGLLPLNAVLCLGENRLAGLDDFVTRMRWFKDNRAEYCHGLSLSTDREDVMAVVDEDQLRRLLTRLLDETEFLSGHGLRALSAAHRAAPFELTVEGVTGRVDYEPGESTSNLFGGNSNWRGPVWMPVNVLLIDAIRRYAEALGPRWSIECPAGSGRQCSLDEVADELASRAISLFRLDGAQRRPVWGGYDVVQRDPRWRDLIPFHEYFHGDTGAGLGASHQTGWTGLVANLILER
jgi:hypothetical protein